MSTNEDDKEEYFLRASLLLLKGGGLMSKETLNREVQKAGENLDVLLKRHKGNLKHKFSTEQRNKLCLDGGTTCVEQWDLAMLTLVPLTVFKLSLNEDEKKALKCIKYKRDTVYAHTHSSVLSFDDYDDIRNDLEKALHVLSNGLSDYVKDECDKIIQQCTTGPISPSVKAELSKQLKGTEDLVKAVMTKLTDTHKAIMDMRNEIMEKLEKMSMNQDRSEKIIKVICTELTLSGAENESDDIDFVDEIVTTVINKATTKVGNNDYPKIHLAVKNILREIENIPDVKILPAAQKCVLLKFECTTYTSILQMLRYLESESFLELLKELASAVNTDLPDAKGPFRVDATVTTDCMTELLDALRAETSSRYTRSIRMQTEVQTVHGVKHIWSLFEKGGVTNTLQKLSEAVFDELKTRITITPSIDVGQVYDALKEADVQSGGSMQESHVAIRDGAHHHEQIESGSSKHASPERQNASNEDFDFKDKDTHFKEKDVIAETNELFRSLIEVKSYSNKQASDSGFCSGAASSMDGQSNISEGRDECMEVPQKEEVIDDKDETASGKMVLQDLQNALVFKVGAGTGLTYGYMERDALGSKEQGLKGYMLVRSLGEKPFAAPGDGGALVFHRRAKDWSCIGVLIGRSSTGTYVVKTIKEILEGFEQYIGRSIALDTPFMDPQVSAILDNEK